jgi:hypothetical protein
LTQFTQAEQLQLEAQTGNPLVDIVNGNVPLGSPVVSQAWSTLSLLLGLIGVVDALILALGFLLGRRKDDETVRSTVIKAAAIVLGVAVMVVFLMTENLAQPMVWINQWTIPVGIAFVAHLAAIAVYNLLRTKKATTTPTASYN